MEWTIDYTDDGVNIEKVKGDGKVSLKHMGTDMMGRAVIQVQHASGGYVDCEERYSVVIVEKVSEPTPSKDVLE